MKNKYVFVAGMLCAILLLSVSFTGLYVKQNAKYAVGSKEQVTIVTSFYPMYVAVSNLVDGIDEIRVRNLSEPQTGCLHDFQLTPEDMKLLSGADVFVVNGGGILFQMRLRHIRSFKLCRPARGFPYWEVKDMCMKKRRNTTMMRFMKNSMKRRTDMDMTMEKKMPMRG